MTDITATIAEPEDITASIAAPEDISVTVAGGIGANKFIELTDTPTTYSGQSGKNISVNSTEDGVEFTSSGLGDVVGPASSSDDAIATFNTTSGELLQDSGLICVDNKIYQSGYTASYIKFNDGTIEIWAGGVKQAAWN